VTFMVIVYRPRQTHDCLESGMKIRVEFVRSGNQSTL